MPLGGAKDEHFSCFYSSCQWGLICDLTNYFPFFLQLRVVTGQLFLPELVVFKTTLWLKGFTLRFPGSNIQSFMISVQDLEKFPPLPDPKICKWSTLVWEFCPDRTRVWFPKSTKVKLITCFHDSWIYDSSFTKFSLFSLQGSPDYCRILVDLSCIMPWFDEFFELVRS